MRTVVSSIVTSVLLLASALPAFAQGTRALTFTDLMKIRQVEHEAVSADGRWVAFTAEPDRGDPEVVVRSTSGDTRHVVPLGSHPVVSADGAWVAIRSNPSLESRETAAPGDAPQRNGSPTSTSFNGAHRGYVRKCAATDYGARRGSSSARRSGSTANGYVNLSAFLSIQRPGTVTLKVTRLLIL